MEYSCPGCSRKIAIDLGEVASFSLQLKCPGCSKALSLSNRDQAFVDKDKSASEQQLADMVQVALADGSVCESELALLKSKVKEMGLEEQTLDRFLARGRQGAAGEGGIQLVEVYSEDKEDYRQNEDFYDWHRFVAKIATLRTDNPNIKRYRDDLIEMVSLNADAFKQLARSWDRIYDNSSDSTDWDEILENKNRCLELASYLRGLREELASQTKANFISYVRVLARSVNTEGDW